MVDSVEKLEEYPFVKQEFLSLTGYGNLIQFYEKRFGGSTEIGTPNLCSKEDVSVIDDCSIDDFGEAGKECQVKELTKVYLDGTAKCEINDSTVARKGETGSEVLLLKSINVNACNIYMMKGDKKQYFKLGKIFGQNKSKYQRERQFTIQLENDDYLVFKDDTIKKVSEKPISDTGDISDEYIFLLTVDTDIYGMYFMFSPKLSPNRFLTRQVDIFNNKIIKDVDEEFTLAETS